MKIIFLRAHFFLLLPLDDAWQYIVSERIPFYAHIIKISLLQCPFEAIFNEKVLLIFLYLCFAFFVDICEKVQNNFISSFVIEQ